MKNPQLKKQLQRLNESVKLKRASLKFLIHSQYGHGIGDFVPDDELNKELLENYYYTFPKMIHLTSEKEIESTMEKLKEKENSSDDYYWEVYSMAINMNRNKNIDIINAEGEIYDMYITKSDEKKNIILNAFHSQMGEYLKNKNYNLANKFIDSIGDDHKIITTDVKDYFRILIQAIQ